MEKEILKRLKEFTRDLERGNLSNYIKTKIIRNKDHYVVIQSHKGKIKKRKM
jgi:hypothetical protein